MRAYYVSDILYILTHLTFSTNLSGWPHWPHFLDKKTEKLTIPKVTKLVSSSVSLQKSNSLNMETLLLTSTLY